MHRETTSGEDDDTGGCLPLTISRRDVLSASNAAVLGTFAGAASVSKETGTRDPEAVLLTLEDLLAPGSETYVGWETGEEPLLETFRRAVPGFGAAPAAGRSFLATPGEQVPAVVETGAVSLADLSPRSVVSVTHRWVRRRAAEVVADVDVARTQTGIEWRTQVGDTLDVVHLQRAGGYLLITIASGVPEGRVPPEEAVGHYAGVMRRKARR